MKRPTINKRMLAHKYREKIGCTYEKAIEAINAFSTILMEELAQDHRVMLGKLGTLLIVHRQARIGVNPATGEKIEVPARPITRIKQTTSFRNFLFDTLK